jgi:hypothetical protein
MGLSPPSFRCFGNRHAMFTKIYVVSVCRTPKTVQNDRDIAPSLV